MADERSRHRRTGEPAALSDTEPVHRRAIGAVLVAGLAAVLGATVWVLPREHAALPAVARQAMLVAVPKWHILEPVNEVVYGTRGFDTFGETFLLLAAVVAIGLVARRREARGEWLGEDTAARAEEPSAAPSGAESDPAETEARQAERGEEGSESGGDGRRHLPTPDAEPLGLPAPERADGMSVVVRGGIRVLAPVLAVAGLYLAAWGYSPGGGFPGGAVIAGVVVFAYAAYGRRKVARFVGQQRVEAIEIVGALCIVVVELGGLVVKGSFSANWLPLGQTGTIPAGGVLQAFSASELVEVATGITLAIFGVLSMAHDWAPNEQPTGGEGDGGNRHGGGGEGGQGDGGDGDRGEGPVATDDRRSAEGRSA